MLAIFCPKIDSYLFWLFYLCSLLKEKEKKLQQKSTDYVHFAHIHTKKKFKYPPQSSAD